MADGNSLELQPAFFVGDAFDGNFELLWLTAFCWSRGPHFALEPQTMVIQRCRGQRHFIGAVADIFCRRRWYFVDGMANCVSLELQLTFCVGTIVDGNL